MRSIGFPTALLTAILVPLFFYNIPGTELNSARADDAQDVEFFETRIRPVLVDRCFNCHGPNKQESGLRLDTRGAALAGGDSGPVIVPGKPDDSLLVSVVRHSAEIKMPPNRKLPDSEIAALTRWVEIGAPWPGSDAMAVRAGGDQFSITDEDRSSWSLQPVADPAVPPVLDAEWARTEIDRFILARLEAAGQRPASAADKRTLIRRATIDLTGLPPSPADVSAFLADDSPSAFARVVDRLLDAPQYGERWGRHWLDVARYADTAGETGDYPVREAYRYRNWVIAAIARDVPYDQFLREQIAGDILAREETGERYEQLLTATGFIAVSRRFGFDAENYHHLTIQDTLDTVGQAVLGLTIGCARCHNHKYDPISIQDYYALYGIFESTRYAFPGSEQKQRPYDFLPAVPPAAAELQKKAWDDRGAELERQIAALNEQQRQLEVQIKNQPSSSGTTTDDLREQLTGIQSQLKQLTDQRAQHKNDGPYPVVFGVREGEPKDARIHKRGDHKRLGEVVPRRYLEILGGQRLESAGSGRLELAQWLTDPRNPLAARVMVNRIWKWHFGDGLVRTPNDFGRRGQPPTHPALLDYLATRFVEDGWSIKQMQRRIMLSATYQLSSDADSQVLEADPENRLLGRFQRRRLEAEAIRDALLAVSGNLDPTPGEAHPFPPVDTWGFSQHNPFRAVYETKRRSVYLMVQRQHSHPFLSLFDGADPNASTGQRVTTMVPTQALYMLNSPFFHEQAAAFATRLCTSAADDSARIDLAFETALSRPPSGEERQAALEFLGRYDQRLGTPGAAAASLPAWSAYARVVLASNEFLFVD